MTGPQTSIPLAATVLGLVGTVCWALQLVPQIWRSWRTKDTEGLPAAMMFLWSASGVPFAVYAVLQNQNLPVQIQPQFFCLLCMVSWGQTRVYSGKWPAWRATAACAALLALFAGLQVLFILVLRGPYAAGVGWPVQLFGILATVLLLAGYVPVPAELWKRRGRVVGISLYFLAVDWNGAFFSLMSLVAQNTFDEIFGTLYAMCAAIELGMFVSHGIWYLRTLQIRRRAKEAGVAFDDFPEAQAWMEGGFKLDLGRRVKKLRGDVEGNSSGVEDGAEEKPDHGKSGG